MSNTKKIVPVSPFTREATFNAAYEGSYYTILGCGGSLNEWVAGYSELLDVRGIGTPSLFITFKGSDLNEFYGLTGENAYRDELTCLMFPLDSLDVARLAIFKLQAGDRWFDDLVYNNRRRQEIIDER